MNENEIKAIIRHIIHSKTLSNLVKINKLYFQAAKNGKVSKFVMRDQIYE